MTREFLQPWEWDKKIIPKTINISGEKFTFTGFPYKSKSPAETGLEIVREQGYNARLRVYKLSGRKKLYAIFRGKKRPIAKSKQATKPKFKIGDKVYSYLNPRSPREIGFIIPSNDPKYQHTYKLTLYDKHGLSYSSKHISEKSLRKSPIPKGREYL